MTGGSNALWQDWSAAEDGAQSAETSVTPAVGALVAEIADIESKMGTPEYIRDEGMQARLRELYAAQHSGAASAPVAARAQERAEIEGIMRADPRRYYKDEGMQARYRELLQDDVSNDAGQDSGAGLIELPSFADWRNAGGDGADLVRRMDIAREANDILASVSESERIALGASFDALPQSVQGAAFAVLGDGSAVASYPLSDEDMTELRRVPVYAGLIREWGHDAPRKFALARERLWRVLDRLSDGEARLTLAWIDGLPKAAMAALTRRMAR